MESHYFWINNRQNLLEIVVTGYETIKRNDIRVRPKGYRNPLLRGRIIESPPVEIKLTDLQNALLQEVALKNQNSGVLIASLNAEIFNDPSNTKNLINKAFQDRLGKDFILMPRISGGILKFNGEPYEPVGPFTTESFFKLFLSGINCINYKHSIFRVEELQQKQKEEIFFSIFGETAVPPCNSNDFLIMLNTVINSIKNNSIEVFFSEKRKKLKELLVLDDVFSDEKKDKTENYSVSVMKVLQEAIKDDIEKWKASENIFPIGKKYYSRYKDFILKEILSENYDTYIKATWLDSIKDCDFSPKKQQEEKCLYIDDVIVSLALVAFSNWTVENDDSQLKEKRASYTERLVDLLEQRFDPTTYFKKQNANDIIITSIIREVIGKADYLFHKGSITEEGRAELIVSLEKIIRSQNKYNNEQTDILTKEMRNVNTGW